jgi:hypothetical protein
LIENLFQALNQVKAGNGRLKVAPTLMVRMDNSMCQNEAKITAKMSLKGLRRTLHPLYSPDISSCDFWALGTIKEMITDQHLQGLEEILRAIQQIWSYFAFEDFQNVFKLWMERLT